MKVEKAEKSHAEYLRKYAFFRYNLSYGNVDKTKLVFGRFDS